MRMATMYRVCAGAGLLIFGGSAVWANTTPVVSNVTAGQRTDGSMRVDIGYDLADADGDPCTVSVAVSDDGGSTWSAAAVSLTGDVGAGITPGTGKAIVWNCGADLPGATGTDYVVRVYADDGHVTPGMVLIPGGEFEMGRHIGGGAPDELPVHAVYIDSFHMDIYEVTNRQYANALNWAQTQGGLVSVSDGVVYDTGGSTPYCDTTSSSSESRITWDGVTETFGVTAGKEDHPMLLVSWHGAAAYANWRSIQEGRTPSYNLSTWECDFEADGYRLPTEAEWEYAARGGEHDPYYRFPWGSTIDGSMADFLESGDLYETGDYPWTTPVRYYDGNQVPAGSDMANGYGLYDVAGNVWEWCNDRDGTYFHCDPPPCVNPRGPDVGAYRVLRGGSWLNYDYNVRCSFRARSFPVIRYYILGFRLALD